MSCLFRLRRRISGVKLISSIEGTEEVVGGLGKGFRKERERKKQLPLRNLITRRFRS